MTITQRQAARLELPTPEHIISGGITTEAEKAMADTIKVGDRLNYPAQPWDYERLQSGSVPKQYVPCKVVRKYPHMVEVESANPAVRWPQRRTITYREMVGDRHIWDGVKRK